jgi:hypothetical protein
MMAEALASGHPLADPPFALAPVELPAPGARQRIRPRAVPTLPTDANGLASVIQSLFGSAPPAVYDGWLSHADLRVRLAVIGNPALRRAGAKVRGTSGFCYVWAIARARGAGHLWTRELDCLCDRRTWPDRGDVTRAAHAAGLGDVEWASPAQLLAPLEAWVAQQATPEALAPLLGGVSLAVRVRAFGALMVDDPVVLAAIDGEPKLLKAFLGRERPIPPQIADAVGQRSVQVVLDALHDARHDVLAPGERTNLRPMFQALFTVLNRGWQMPPALFAALESHFWLTVRRHSDDEQLASASRDHLTVMQALLRPNAGGDAAWLDRLHTALAPDAVPWDDILVHPAANRTLMLAHMHRVHHHSTWARLLSVHPWIARDDALANAVLLHGTPAGILAVARHAADNTLQRALALLVERAPWSAVDALESLSPAQWLSVSASTLAPLLQTGNAVQRQRVIVAVGRAHDAAPSPVAPRQPPRTR